MSTEQPYYAAQEKQWSMLLVYNIYRLVDILVLFALFWADPHTQLSPVLYFGSLFIYLLVGLFFIQVGYARSQRFEQQVLLSGTIDIIALVAFITVLGYMQSGLGILLNATIAVLSILVPGRLAIFFASMASFLLLGISTIKYMGGVSSDLSTFFSIGIYGTGFFATALTAWYLAHWVRMNERLAQHRGKELAGLQRVNEYIVEKLQYGVIYLDMDQHIKVINTAARGFFKVGHNDTPLSLDQISSPLHKKYQQFLSKKGDFSVQTTLKKPYLQVRFFSTTTAGQTAVLIILDDMLAIAQQAQQMKLASLGRFSASIAHELRNPLGVISHAAQLMEETSLNEEDVRLRELIINNCNRMNDVIKNVLQLSRREQSKPRPIKLKPFVEQFKRDFCMVNPCEITVELSEKTDTTIFFDKSQLEQVVIILCDNAIQHGKNIDNRVEIGISVKQEPQTLKIRVSDTGPGIPKAIREEVFEPFFSTVRVGTGMGLFIARDLCEINHARLHVKPTKQGCCFELTVIQSDEMVL